MVLKTTVTGSPSQPWGGALAISGREDAAWSLRQDLTPTPEEGGGAWACHQAATEAEPLASHAWEGVVYRPMAGKQLKFGEDSPAYMRFRKLAVKRSGAQGLHKFRFLDRLRQLDRQGSK